jgi:hypothetical protein
VRDAAGSRFADLELNVRVLGVAVGCDGRPGAERVAGELGAPEEDVIGSPFTLVGSPAQVEEQILRQRDELGISYYTVSHRHAAAVTPVVDRLAGR